MGPPKKHPQAVFTWHTHRQTWACFRELTRIKSNSFSRQFIAEGSNQLLINTRQTEIGLWSWEPQHFSKLLKHPSIEFILTCGQVFQSSSVISECRSDWELFGKRPLMSLYKKKKEKEKPRQAQIKDLFRSEVNKTNAHSEASHPLVCGCYWKTTESQHLPPFI